MITIKKVETKNDWKEFIDLPFRLYKDDKNWVPPLKKDMFLNSTLRSIHSGSTLSGKYF